MDSTQAFAAFHQSAWRVLPVASGAGFSQPDWAATVAAIGAWPALESTQPVLERRFWRTSRRGLLHETVIAGLGDPLGVCSATEAAAELRELTRPLWSVRALPPVSASVLGRLQRPAVGYAAELCRLDSGMPEGGAALAPLFAHLLDGLAAVEGPVGLSLLVAPLDATYEEEDEPHGAAAGPGEPVAIRRVAFGLRLFAARPIAATLLARAEATCLARRPGPGDWHVASRPQEIIGATRAIGAQRLVRPRAGDSGARADIAALTLSLPAPVAPGASVVTGRPVTGPLSTDGPVVGRVPRQNGRHVPWRLSWADRQLHVLLAGASGCGKTTTILRFALDDIANGRTVVLVDPHGDLADQLAAVAPRERLVHIDPRRPDTAALDLLDADPARSASHLLSAASEVWPSGYAGPVYQRAVSLACRCLHETSAIGSRATVADLERFFVDVPWRAKLVAGIPDTALAAELKREHEVWQKAPIDDSSLVNWIASKITPLTQGPGRPMFAAPVIRPLETDIASGSIVVVALPVGTLGPATTEMVARMFLTRLTAAVAAQGDRPEEDRHPVSVIVDEAHLAAGKALGGLFAQARKFNCSLTVACQSPSQLQPHLEDVLTNAQTHLFGRLSQREAQHLAARVGERGVRALPRLPRHHLLLATEDNDPDLAPVVLTPVAPPALLRAPPREVPTTLPSAAPPSTFDDVLADLLG